MGPFESSERVVDGVSNESVSHDSVGAQKAIACRTNPFNGTLGAKVARICVQFHSIRTYTFERVRKQQELRSGIDPSPTIWCTEPRLT